MKGTVFAMAVALLALAAVSGTSQAAPIAPLSAAASTDAGGVTPIYYYHRYYHPYYDRRIGAPTPLRIQQLQKRTDFFLIVAVPLPVFAELLREPRQIVLGTRLQSVLAPRSRCQLQS